MIQKHAVCWKPRSTPPGGGTSLATSLGKILNSAKVRIKVSRKVERRFEPILVHGVCWGVSVRWAHVAWQGSRGGDRRRISQSRVARSAVRQGRLYIAFRGNHGPLVL